MPWIRLTCRNNPDNELLLLFGPGGVLSAQETTKGFTVLMTESGSRHEVRERAHQIQKLLAAAGEQSN